MIYTWIADISPLCSDERRAAIFARLPKFRREKAAKLRFAKNRAQSVGVWTLLELAREKYKIPEKAPYNLSHSKDYVIVSADTKEGPPLLGCDIEKIGHVTFFVAKRLFCSSEVEYIASIKEKDKRLEAACRLWVLKESFMKAVKKGIALGTKNIEVSLRDPPVILKKPEQYGQKFYFCEYAPTRIPYRIAVCSDKDDFAPALMTEWVDYFSRNLIE